MMSLDINDCASGEIRKMIQAHHADNNVPRLSRHYKASRENRFGTVLPQGILADVIFQTDLVERGTRSSIDP
jgi:hypothetical protein